jgi:NAD(P)-dependent dehydrogenase (short-subunit alcohol dehydrogenase family)
VTGLARRVALVTGAGRGIGRATAISLAAQGMPVVAAARSVDELDAVPGIGPARLDDLRKLVAP